MSGKGRILLAALLVATSLWGFARLFVLRFQSGDIYPPYSSLRADPLGVRILYESFGQFPELRTSRNFRPLTKLPSDPATLFLPGAPTFGFLTMDSTGRELQTFAFRGGRVIVSLLATSRTQWFDEQNGDQSEAGKRDEDESCATSNGVPPKETKKQSAYSKHGNNSEDIRPSEKSCRPFKPARWDFKVETETNKTTLLSETADVVANNSPAPLPSRIAWKGRLCFSSISNGWRVIYQRDKRPVVIERRFGKGSIVVLADSYLLSNEAMWRHREPALLAWLVGQGPRVIFDETHFGLMEQPGVGALARKYRLSGFVAGFFLLALLFLWKESSALVPPYREPPAYGEHEWIVGRDSMAALANLLRRNVRPSELLSLCAQLWGKSATYARIGREEALKKINDIVGWESAKVTRQQDLARAYQRIGKMLKERK